MICKHCSIELAPNGDGWKHVNGLVSCRSHATQAEPSENCECESAKCDHENACNRTPSQNVATIYGTFKMCQTCAYRMPEEFLKH